MKINAGMGNFLPLFWFIAAIINDRVRPLYDE